MFAFILHVMKQICQDLSVKTTLSLMISFCLELAFFVIVVRICILVYC